MPIIELPKLNVKDFSINDVYLKGDDTSVNQYCLENGYTLDSYVVENQRFSNDGGLLYQYYDTLNSEWKTEFGYSKIVVSITYSI